MNNKLFLSPLIVLSLTLAACLPIQTPDSSPFTTPDPDTYVSLMPVINEYFYLLKQAVLTGNSSPFFSRFPDLATGTDLEKGINAEAHHITSLQSLAPIDGNIHPEYYEPIKIKASDIELEILLHGMELYLWQNEDGAYNESGGEFRIVLFLRKQGDSWQIYQTDQVTLSEWKDTDF